MSDITKIKVDGEPESSYQLYPRNEEFAKRAGGNTGSHSGVQSDWNQNDETAPDYVKNRPFYTGAPVETVLLEETTVEFVYQNGFYLAEFPVSFNAEFGQTYKISWDRTIYECTCENYNNVASIGNQYFLGVGSDTGDPFVIFNQSGLNETGWVSGTTDTSASHTISISVITQEIVKVDEKYLPESAFTDAEWSKISNKIVDYKQQSLSLSVSGEQISMTAGNTYSKNKINDNLKFEDGKVYEINGSITLYNPVGNNESVLNINGYYTCSNGGIVFGSCYDTYYKKDILVSLYSSDSVVYQGKLRIRSKINVSNTLFTFDINITVTGEAKQLPDICIGENIQRVEGKALILPSSTEGSTKKFKITVDDSGTLTATEVI